VLLKLLDYAVEIWIAAAKAPCEPVSTALRDRLAVSNHFELTRATRCGHRVNVKACLDQGHEPRDLGVVVVSCRAMNDFDLHASFIVHRVNGWKRRLICIREFCALRRASMPSSNSLGLDQPLSKPLQAVVTGREAR